MRSLGGEHHPCSLPPRDTAPTGTVGLQRLKGHPSAPPLEAAVAGCTWNTGLGDGSGCVILGGEDVAAGPLDLRKSDT